MGSNSISNKKLDELEARAFADMIMSGPCPTCSSDNVHSCEYDPEDPDDSVLECEIAKAIDSPVTGLSFRSDAMFLNVTGDFILETHTLAPYRSMSYSKETYDGEFRRPHYERRTSGEEIYRTTLSLMMIR